MSPRRWVEASARGLWIAGARRAVLGAVFGALGVAGCGEAPMVDAGAGALDSGLDAATMCATDDDCEDGLACNGEARCLEGRCVAGMSIDCDDSIACTTDFCSEELRRCVNRPPDADGDGVYDVACLDARGMPFGGDCDDMNPAVLPGAAELCDAMHVDEDCDPSTLGGRDGDGDGFVDVACCNGTTCGDDCNDAVRGASPSGTEVCNGIDDDCDGNVDEEVQVLVYRDLDGDGRGDATSPLRACAVTPGYSVFDDDCDDTDANRSPLLFEACDGVDNDCDGTPDPADAPTITSWYEDSDGDGFGNPSVVVEACARPGDGYSLQGRDCDDADPARHPRMRELCNAIDDDCNGLADFALGEGDFEDDDHDGHADARCSPAPVDPDCDDRDATTSAGGEEICDGRDNDCDTRVDEGVGMTLFYRDDDHDGHGSESSGVALGCGAVAGYVTSHDDCDDMSDTRFPGAVEGCNSRDDDCDSRVDEDPLLDICMPDAMGPRTCAYGMCGHGSAECPSGFADCDHAADNGCETPITSDPEHCGSCTRHCAVESHASSGCALSRCTALVCDGLFLDCNGDLGRGGDGCETDGGSDVTSCGRCGQACPAFAHVTASSCRSGACGFDPATDCDAGWLDCNGVVDDGCEAQLGTDGSCSGCGDACAVTEECDATRSCRPRVCPGSTADCDSNGSCETDLDTTVASCGSCGAPCTGHSANWSCVGGSCRVASCVGTTDDCDGLDATGCEVDTSNDVDHCGRCATACAGHQALWACASSACQVVGCLAGSDDCDGAAGNGCEIDIDGDPSNCGVCGRVCTREPGTVAPSCSLGVCSAPVCAMGRLDCNGDLGVMGGDGCETTGSCALLDFAPATYPFGSVAALSSSGPGFFTLRNLGGSVSGRIDTWVDGADAAEFAITSDDCIGRTLAPSASCSMIVTFSPTSTGPRGATLLASARPGATAATTLTGTGLISTLPTSRDYGASTVGQPIAAAPFAIRNPGTVGAGTLTVSIVGPNAADFTLTDPCSGTTLAAGAMCTVNVGVTPGATGTRTATLRVVATLGGTTTAPLMATGSAPITTAPTTHNFGGVTLGANSAPQTFTVSNPGTLTTGALSVMLGGANPSEFGIVTNTCAGSMVAPSGTCTVSVRFSPTVAGARTATLSVSGVPGGTSTTTLNGTGSLPIASSPASAAFPTQTVGLSTAPQTFTISNPGTIATGALAVTMTGANPGDFVIGTNTCAAASLSVGGNCQIQVTFQPAMAGARAATLHVQGAPGGAVDVALTGAGSLPISMTPTPTHNFGGMTIGGLSAPQSFVVTNGGSIATGPLSVTITGANPADFQTMGNTCTGASVPAAGNCTVTVYFGPNAAGARSATLTVSGAPGGTVATVMNGTGSLAITVSPTTIAYPAVAVGSDSGQVTLTISNPGTIPTGSMTYSASGPHGGDVSFGTATCFGTLAPGASCTMFMSVNPSALGPASSTFTVSASPGGSASTTLTWTGIALQLGSVTSGAANGTGPFYDTDCPAGQAMVGIAGHSGALIDQLQPICAPIAITTDSGGAMYTYPVVFAGGASPAAPVGDSSGTPYVDYCPANQFVTQIAGRVGDDMDQFQVYCAPITVLSPSPGSYTWGFLVGSWTSARGGSGGVAFGPQGCPASPAVLTGLGVGWAPAYTNGAYVRCSGMSIM
ncbi:MAG: choice-of-anchor D domain-containing protein [Sandaracinaceae bacterium]|nr:choice-of-anchor D domain-containing protein [Sandaracinaceae bacterium]